MLGSRLDAICGRPQAFHSAAPVEMTGERAAAIVATVSAVISLDQDTPLAYNSRSRANRKGRAMKKIGVASTAFAIAVSLLLVAGCGQEAEDYATTTSMLWSGSCVARCAQSP